MGTLWNTYAFYVLYANIDEFNPMEHTLDESKMTVMDKWLMSRLNSMVKTVDENLANYRIPEAARALQDFTDEMSNWYVRRGRERYWVQGLTDDKIVAYMTLYKALVTTAKTAAPMIPFMAESIYLNLVKSVDDTAPKSVHLCEFPEVDEKAIDPELENNMDKLLGIVVLGRAARNGSGRKNRQPLSTMFVESDHELSDDYVEIIKDELNVKSVEFKESLGDFVSYVFKPQLKTVGPKYGKQLNEIRTALDEIDGTAAKAELDRDGSLKLDLPGGAVVLNTEDLLISTAQKEGFFTLSDRGVTVALDTNLTPELIDEGFVREIVSKIQTMRKEADFNVMDHINITVSGSEKIAELIGRKPEDITGDTLADSITITEPKGFVKEWDINGETVTIGVEKI